MQRIFGRIGTALLTVVLVLPLMAPSHPAKQDRKHRGGVDIVCMQKAVGTRDDALIAAWGTFGAAVTNAFIARKTALVDVWGIADKKQRNEAQKKAWALFKDARKAAKKAWHDAQKASWETFRASARVCKADQRELEGAGEIQVEVE